MKIRKKGKKTTKLELLCTRRKNFRSASKGTKSRSFELSFARGRCSRRSRRSRHHGAGRARHLRRSVAQRPGKRSTTPGRSASALRLEACIDQKCTGYVSSSLRWKAGTLLLLNMSVAQWQNCLEIRRFRLELRLPGRGPAGYAAPRRSRRCRRRGRRGRRAQPAVPPTPRSEAGMAPRFRLVLFFSRCKRRVV